MADKDNKKEAEVVEEEEQAVIAYHYLPAENPQNASYPGVPLRDLLVHEVDTYPKWVQKSIEASAMYTNEAPGAKAKGKG